MHSSDQYVANMTGRRMYLTGDCRRVRKLLTMNPYSDFPAVPVVVSSVAQPDFREVHDEHFFLPKALAVSHTLTAAPLVGSKEAAVSTRTD